VVNGVIIGHWAWKKWLKNESEAACENRSETGFLHNVRLLDAGNIELRQQ
jgi:hypothetical protein